MENLNTFDTILAGFAKLAESKGVIDPHKWLEGAAKLSALMGNEMDTLIEMEHHIAVMRKEYLEKGNTATYSKMMIEATDEYKQVQHQKARIKNAQDTILICKKFATLTSDQMRSGM